MRSGISSRVACTLSLSLGLAAWACSTSPSATTPGPGADASDATPAETSAPDASDAAGGPATSSVLILNSTAAAAFGSLRFVNVAAAEGERCFTSRSGSCLVTDCRARGASAAPLRGVSAGEVRLLRAGAPLFTISPDPPTKIYTYATRSEPTWTPGDAMRLVASGGEIPAFDIPLTAPGALTITSPSLDAGAPVIDRASGLRVTWLPLTSGQVTIGLVQQERGASGSLETFVRLMCEVDGTRGEATVPAASLAALSADPALGNTLFIGASTALDVTQGGYSVHASLVWTDGAVYPTVR